MDGQVEIKKVLVEPLEMVVAPATTAPIKIADYFGKSARVRFATVWDEFKTRFFDKTEGPLVETTYRKYALQCIAADLPIIAELGGEAKVEGTVTAALSFVHRQPNGGPGFLQTNGYANIFYARDKKSELCAVRIGWSEGGWVIDALSVRDPLAWNGRHQIFCPVE